jgi:transposase-like protein
MRPATRRKINAVLKAKIALDALTKQTTIADLVQRHQVHPNQIYAWKKQLRGQAARAFETGGQRWRVAGMPIATTTVDDDSLTRSAQRNGPASKLRMRRSWSTPRVSSSIFDLRTVLNQRVPAT